MNRLILLTAMLLALGSLTAGEAAADDCVALGGVDNVTECTINAPVIAQGAFSLEKTLHITPTGNITVPKVAGGNTLTISICTANAQLCDLQMDIGAQISGDVTGTGAVGAAITINASDSIVLEGDGGSNGASITSNQTAGSCTGGRGGTINLNADFDIFIEKGAKVTANARCPAGVITIASAQGSVDIDGLVESVSQLSGTGGGRRGGGPITVVARCDLDIDGVLRSQGGDPGADLIYVEGGCAVTITGLIESFGSGHDIPDVLPNHCAGVSNPTKDPNSTACVQIVAGDSLLITNTAEIRADTGNGGIKGFSWIDIFTRGLITVQGRSVQPFSVHANGNGGSNDQGGEVTVKSRDAGITASGLAFQASSTNSGGDGGKIVVEASLDIDLSSATVEARGSTSGTDPHGGSIAIRSFNEDILSDASSVLDVTGGNPSDGTVDLTACKTIGFPPGTVSGAGVLNKTPGVCGGAPTIPVALPDCLCGTQPGDGFCPEDDDKLLHAAVDPSGTPHGVLPVYPTLQQAVDSTPSGLTIGVFTHAVDPDPSFTTENVVIPNKTLIITQCTTARIVALDDLLPVIQISSPDKITIIGLDTIGGSVGYQIDTDGHDLKSVRATGATDACIWVKGNKNRVTWNALRECGVGLRVDGAKNDLRGGTIEGNASHGVWFAAPATGNKLQGATINDNGGNGILISEGADANTVSSNKMDLNDLNGAKISGSANIVKGNQAGTGPGLGNAKDGFKVTGPANRLVDNKASANLGDGFDVKGGVDGAANLLKGNQSNLGGSGGNRENAQAEYRLLDTVKSGGGNKADGIGVPKVTWPPKCPDFPGGGVIKTFPAESICE